MTMDFVNAMEQENNWKKTENKADALKSTGTDLLDLFATVGALRTRSEKEIEQLFSLALCEDNLLATKLSFYARNIRGGLGERRTARIIWAWLAKLYPEIMKKNLHLVPEFGRWDDMYTFIGTYVEPEMWEIMRAQFFADIEDMAANKPVSLLGKWLKSANASSQETKMLGRLTASKLGLSESQYRRALSKLRSHIDIVEKKMTSGEWTAIEYGKVPSKAMNNYRKAFKTHDEMGFAEYLAKVETGEEKINADTLYPYDIVEKILQSYEHNEVLEQQWKALPNYVEGENNMLVMADVSGSMHGRPMATSVGLAIYFAERNRGVFHNKFMTFSSEPDLVTVTGTTLYEKIHNAIRSEWSMNTDIEKAFRLILNAAVTNNLKQEDLPKSLIIISDMEFDQATQDRTSYSAWGSPSVNRKTYYQHMTELYAEHGYLLPKVIFWNVKARQNTFHARIEDGVQFASGQATSVFKALVDGADLTAYDLMVEALSDPMYAEVTV